MKTLRTDNDYEYFSHELENYLKTEGIIHQKTNPHTPEQNGLCENFNRTVAENVNRLLFDVRLPKNFWTEAANTAVYIENRSVASGLE